MNHGVKIILIGASLFLTKFLGAVDATRAVQQARALKEQEAARNYDILMDTKQPFRVRSSAKEVIEKYEKEKISYVLYLKSTLLKEGLPGFYEKNEEKAAKLCLLAGNGGNLGAKMELAESYEKGCRFIQRNVDKAIECYEYILNYVAALPEDEIMRDYYRVAYLYLEKASATASPANTALYKKAADYFSKVKSGYLNPHAYCSIGVMLEKNQIATKSDKNVAIKIYYDKALNGFDKIENPSLEEINLYVTMCAYCFDILKDKDPQKALQYLEKGLIKNPDALTLHHYYWLLYKKSFEDMDLEKALEHLKFVVDADGEKFKQDPTYAVARVSTLFDYARILEQGAFGLTQDKDRAQKLFNEILERDADEFINDVDLSTIGIMYEYGFGVARNLKNALTYYKKLSTASRQDRVKPLEKKITQENHKKSLTSKTQDLKLNEPSFEEDDFEFLLPVQQDSKSLHVAEIDTKQITTDIIDYFNAQHHMDDGSSIISIDLALKKITIIDPRNNLEIILDAGQKYPDTSFDAYTLLHKKIRSFVYDDRIKQWFTSPYNGNNHFFPKMVDALLQVYGVYFTLSDGEFSGEKTFMLKGSIHELSSGKVLTGEFEYTFYKEKNSDTWVLYHRLFRPFRKSVRA